MTIHPEPLKTVTSWRAIDDFTRRAKEWPDHPAIRVGGQSHSYGALAVRAQAIAAAIQDHETPTSAPVAAIWADRGIDTYAAVLGALMRGFSYVPLNPGFPADRNRLILDRSGASVVIFGQTASESVRAVLAAGNPDPASPGTGTPPRTLLVDDLTPGTRPTGAQTHDNPHVYTLFTSGSTGMPKGVPIRHENLEAYLDAVFKVADYNHLDRMSQNFDLTFDLSAHDMFVCWRAGAELIVPSAQDLERPAEYIRDNRVTCWFSVPTLAQKMRLQGDLGPDRLNQLRLSLFCGEALPVDLARDWAEATGQRVENWYGPTEATIACTRYVLPTGPATPEGRFSLVPIGTPLPGMRALILSPDGGGDGTDAGPGDPGELLIGGPQVADGYLDDPDRTSAAFVVPKGQSEVFYRTGDRVVRDDNGQIQFIDRLDNQIKIRGYRVELGEIEAKLRALAAGCNAVVVPLPLKSASPTSLVGVVEGWQGKPRQLLNGLDASLPDYMMPTRVMAMPQFPRNASGKVDRTRIGKRVVRRLKANLSKSARPRKATRYSNMILDVQRINPAISQEDIENAANLMDAGLDSLGFVEFTVRMEKRFSLTLDQELVSALSQMSMRQITAFVRKTLEQTGADRFRPPAGAFANPSDLKRNMHYRAMRSLDMLDKFPGFVDSARDPLLLCVGSSGFMRGIDTATFEASAKAAGTPVRAANLGMAMLSVEGITELCEFIRDTLKARGRRVAHSVIEMEIMQLSILPPAGDIEMVEEYKKGTFDGVERKYYDDDTVWDQATGGTIPPAQTRRTAAKMANWERRRAREIRDAFEGSVQMDQKAVEAWLRGVAALRDVSDNIIAVIHPIQGEDPARARQDITPNHFQKVVTRLTEETGIRVMLDTEFDLEAEDFKNINHMNDHTGCRKFSAQIAATLFGHRPEPR